MGDIITALKDTPIPTILVVGGIVFLFLAIVGQFVGQIHVPPERQKWAGIVGALLLFAGIALYVAPVSPLVPTPTIVPGVTPGTSTPTASLVVPTEAPMYDDFNALTADEGFDQSRWEVFKYFGCDVRQKDGVAVFSTSSPSPSDIVCGISVTGDKVILEEVGSMEAKLYTMSGAKGDYSIGIIEFSSGTFEEGTTNWIAQCGIRQVPNENLVELFFNVHSTYPQGEPEIYKTVSASVEHWYKMRLEIVPDTVEIRCYADDGLIGSYRPANADVLRTKSFDRHLLGYWTAQSQATYYADDVRLTKR